MQAFSDCLWRGLLILMYCDLLTKKLIFWIVTHVRIRDYTVFRIKWSKVCIVAIYFSIGFIQVVKKNHLFLKMLKSIFQWSELPHHCCHWDSCFLLVQHKPRIVKNCHFYRKLHRDNNKNKKSSIFQSSNSNNFQRLLFY